MTAFYLTSLGLHRNPFPPTPDAQCYFYTAHLDAELAEVAHCIEARKGFMLVTGEVGLGKSTFVRRLLDIVEPKGAVVAMVFNTFLQDRELLSTINHDFGIPPQASMALDMAALNTFLLKQAEEGKPCVLVIDDAQNLSHESLELIRLLCNLETDQEKLLQIILAGQPELLVTLNQNNLRQLKSRIVKHVHLENLSLDEVGRYFDFRLTEAGSAGRLTLDPAACRILHRISGGNLRHIHLILDRCLYGLVATRGQVVTTALVKGAIKETRIGALPGKATSLHFSRRLAWPLALATIVGIGGAGVAAWASGYLPAWNADPVQIQNQAQAQAQTQTQTQTQARVQATATDSAQTALQASASSASAPVPVPVPSAAPEQALQSSPVSSAPTPPVPHAAPAVATVAKVATAAAVVAGNTPAAAPTPAQSTNDANLCLKKLTQHIATAEIRTARIPDALVTRLSDQPSTCLYHTTEGAWISWKPRLRAAELLSPPPNEAVRWVQIKLSSHGLFDKTLVGGRFGPITRQSLANFQARHGLEASGEPDDLTLLLLETDDDKRTLSAPRG